jgi:tetratricopeptide (TPR) repeat protein
MNKITTGGVMVAVVGALMVCAWKQTSYWKNSETLWRHALACTVDNNLAYVNLGHELYTQGRLEEAIALYEAALKNEPNSAEFHNNLANALRESGNMRDAMAEYEKAVQCKPGFADAQFNLGKALALEGKEAEAIARFQTALQIDPNFLLARINLGNTLLQAGRAEEAIPQLKKVLEIQPDNASIHLNLGLCYFQLGKMEEAKSQYEQALQLKPDDPRIQNNLAWLLAAGPAASLRDGKEAVGLAEEANEMTGGENPIILHTLAAAFAQTGDFSNAVETAQQATKLAKAQSNQALTSQLQDELKLYGNGKAFPLLGQTKSSAGSAAGGK